MTKQQLIEIIEKYAPDGEDIAIGGYWFRNDVEDWHGEKLTDDQWSAYVRWFENYQDSGADADEALFYALKGDN